MEEKVQPLLNQQINKTNFNWKKFFWIGGVLIIVVIICVLFILFNKNTHGQNKEVISSPLSNCPNVSDPAGRDVCIWQIVVGQKNGSLCSQMSDQAKDGCYGGIAIDTNDSSFCFNITGVKAKNDCLSSMARRTSNGALCGGMDPSLIYMDGTINTGIPERDYCYIDVAVATRNSSLCSYVINTKAINSFTWTRQSCLDNVAFWLAKDNKDISLCDQIQDQSMKDNCILHVKNNIP
jgi:hypothetical protein